MSAEYPPAGGVTSVAGKTGAVTLAETDVPNLVSDLAAKLTYTSGTHAARLAAAHVANREWKETDTGLIYLDDGTNWIIWKGEGHVAKTADETVNNSAVLQDDDHLFFPIEANERWFVEGFLQADTVTATPDLLLGWSVPAGCTVKWNYYGAPTVSPGGWIAASTAQSNETMQTVARPAGLRGGTISIALAAWFTNGATAGTVKTQWCQNTATVEDTKLLKDSWARIRRLA